MAAITPVYPLGDALAAILARLVSRGEAIAQVDATNDTATPMWCKGIEWIAANHAPPRYVWFPVSVLPGKPEKGDISNQERALISGMEVVEIHSWGATEGEAWAMRRNLLRACQFAAPTAWQYQGDRVVLNGEQNGLHGVVYITTLTFSIPVTDDAEVVVVPVAIHITSKLVKNGVETTDAVFTVE